MALYKSVNCMEDTPGTLNLIREGLKRFEEIMKSILIL